MLYQLRGHAALYKKNSPSFVLLMLAPLLFSSAFFISGCCLNSSLFYPSIADIGPLDQQPTLATLTVAHRGNISTGALPDNSLPALRQGLTAGVPFLEVDVRRSADGVLFLFHDGSFSRDNSNAPAQLRGIAISTLSSADLRKASLDKSNQIQIPTLADALSLLRQHPHGSAPSALQLDLKAESDSLMLDVLELVSSSGLLHRVLLQLRSPERISLALSKYPHARILARCTSPEQLNQALQNRVEAVELERWITSSAVRQAHARGVLVAINIAGSRLDEPSTHDYFRSRGVDMIMTDTGGGGMCSH